MIRWVLNIIVLLLLLRLALRFVLGLMRGLTEPSDDTASAGRRPAGGPARIAGGTRYYCSVSCRDKDAGAGDAQPRLGRTAHG